MSPDTLREQSADTLATIEHLSAQIDALKDENKALRLERGNLRYVLSQACDFFTNPNSRPAVDGRWYDDVKAMVAKALS